MNWTQRLESATDSSEARAMLVNCDRGLAGDFGPLAKWEETAITWEREFCIKQIARCDADHKE